MRKKSKSVSPGVSNLLLYLFFIIVILSCGASLKQPELIQTGNNKDTIISLRLLATTGPEIADNQYLRYPTHIVTNNIGNIFITDSNLHKVIRLESNLNYISDQGGIGISLSGLNNPKGLSCDAALNVYVADSGNKSIKALDRNLRFASEIESYTNDNGESERFINPVDLAVDNEGNLWIADYDRILKISPFNELLLEISYNAPGNFSVGQVSSIVISENDQIAAADPEYSRIVVFSPYGQVLSEINSGPVSSLAWDNNLIWAVSESGQTVSVFSISGNLLFKWAESVPGSKINAIAIDRNKSIIMIDSGRKKILLYEKISGIGTDSEN